MTSKKSIVGFILLLSVIGMVFAWYLTRTHYALMIPGNTVTSICNINAIVNCDLVNASKYSSIYHIPVAGLGFLYYVICFILSLAALRNSTASIAFPEKGDTSSCNPTFFFLFLLSGGALAVSLAMAYLSYRLGAVCLFCIGLYIVNILLFILFHKAARVPWKGFANFLIAYFLAPGHFIKMGLVTLVVLAIGTELLWSTTKSYETRRDEILEWKRRHGAAPARQDYTEEDIQKILDTFYKQPALDIEIPDNRSRWGSKDAPLQIVKFVDFQCPACKQATEIIPDFLNQNYKGKFAIILMNFPLDSDCNKGMKRKMHPFGCEAAKIGVCLQKTTDNFWDYEELAFGNQSEINSTKLHEWAKTMGLDEETLTACLAAPDTQAWIDEDVAIAGKIPVEGTPTILLNGRNLQSMWRDPVLFKRVLDAELEKAGER